MLKTRNIQRNNKKNDRKPQLDEFNEIGHGKLRNCLYYLSVCITLCSVYV